MIYGVDWGGYDYDAMQVENLASRAGCSFFISQAGGAGTPKLIKRAKNAGMITGTYYWNSALISAQAQIDAYSFLIDQDKPDIIILDFEHYWAKWDDYWAAIAGTIPWANVTRMSAQKISDNGQSVCEGIIKRWSGKYYLNYSADWFVSGYASPSTTWLKKYPFFVAAYPDYGVSPYSLTWDQIKSGKFMHLKSGLQNIADYRPTLPADITQWDLWQYSSRIKIPGEYYAYDWDLFNGSLDQLKAKCGLISPPTEPTVEERLTSLENRVTAIENKSILGQ